MDYFGVEEEIEKMTPEECVQSINMLSSAIGSTHRDICLTHLCKVNDFHSWKTYLVHHFLLYCKTINLDISRSHAFFLDGI